MNTLYIHMPSRCDADRAAQWHELECRFALADKGGSIAREGLAPLSKLAATIAKVQQVVAILAAGDVTLLRVRVPPLAAGKMKAALPGLVEEKLLAEPSACVLVAENSSGGMSTVAVVQRAWIERLAAVLTSMGARKLKALPPQLCLPYPSGQPSGSIAAVIDQGSGIELLLRFSAQEGIGLAISREQQETPTQVISTLSALVPEAPLALYVPQTEMRAYQEAIAGNAGAANRFSVFADSWTRWMAGANAAGTDLMTGLRTRAQPGGDWRAWRWPLGLVAALLAINAAALNYDWWRMKYEAGALRASMIQTFKSAYPKETVILDPLAQMRQKIALAKRESGQPEPDDFTAITAAFGEAWGSAKAGNAISAIASVEYRERSLFIKLKPGADAPLDSIRNMLAARGLTVAAAATQTSGALWQIRRAE